MANKVSSKAVVATSQSVGDMSQTENLTYWPAIEKVLDGRSSDGKHATCRPLVQCAICDTDLSIPDRPKLPAPPLRQDMKVESGMVFPDCKHTIGVLCMETWINSVTTPYATCPICRKQLSDSVVRQVLDKAAASNGRTKGSNLEGMQRYQARAAAQSGNRDDILYLSPGRVLFISMFAGDRFSRTVRYPPLSPDDAAASNAAVPGGDSDDLGSIFFVLAREVTGNDRLSQHTNNTSSPSTNTTTTAGPNNATTGTGTGTSQGQAQGQQRQWFTHDEFVDNLTEDHVMEALEEIDAFDGEVIRIRGAVEERFRNSLTSALGDLTGEGARGAVMVFVGGERLMEIRVER